VQIEPHSVDEGIDDRAQLGHDERKEAVPVADVVAVAGHLEDSNPGQRGPGCHPNDDDDQQFQRKLLFQLKYWRKFN
jgi:hypothetical protein